MTAAGPAGAGEGEEKRATTASGLGRGLARIAAVIQGLLDRALGSSPLVLAALFAGAFVIGLTPVADGDIFWHVAAGREMVRLRSWLHTDPFTISAAGRPWTDVHWLFQLAAFAVYQTAGLSGLVIAKALVVATGAVVLANATARSNIAARANAAARAPGAAFANASSAPRTSAPGVARQESSPQTLYLVAVALLAGLFFGRHALAVRPTLVTLLMLALFFAALERSRTRGGRALLWLPALEIVWANCQGLAVLGPALVGAYLVSATVSSGRALPRGIARAWRQSFCEEEQLPLRALLMVWGLCCLAMLVTPYGLETARLPVQLLRRLLPGSANVFSAQIAENIPPWTLDQTSAGGEVTHLWWYLAALAVCIALSRERLFLSRFLVLLGFGALALIANRNILLFYWMAGPIAALSVSHRLDANTSRFFRGRWGRLTLVSVLGGQLGVAAIAQKREGDLASPAPFHFPVESVKHLAKLGAAGPIFAPDHHGGYLALTAPRLRPFIDTRLVLHTAEEYADYLAALDNPEKFEALANTYGIGFVVLTTSYPDRYLGLVRYLASSTRWSLIFTDGSEVLFAREGTALDLGARSVTANILRELQVRHGDAFALHEAARLNLARFLVVVGQGREAQFVLSTSHARAAAQLRARAYFAAGERMAAAALARTLVAADSEDVRSLVLLAHCAMGQGDRLASTGWLKRALAVDAHDVEAHGLLLQLEQLSQRASVRP